MSDPRLNGSHLSDTRHDLYDAVMDELLDERGAATAQADPLARSPRIMIHRPCRLESPPPGGTYTLIDLADGRRFPLRVGINTIGRFAENDIVVDAGAVSRRHCAIVVHATGGCEVYDTASRNHTLVNCQILGRRARVCRTDLVPGDVLVLACQRFLVAWVGPDGEAFPPMIRSETEMETDCLGGLSSTA